MDPKHIHFMNIAAQMSREKMADGEGGPFGAIIVWNDKVIGQGWNQVTSRFDPSAHAEIVAIRNACDHLQNFSLKGAVIYTSCEPCPMCLGAIWWARLDSIYYSNSREDAAQIGFDDAEIYKEVSRATSERHIPMIRCESENAKLAMEEWKRKEDKILY